MSKRDKLDALAARLAALEAERAMIRRHVETLCRATRRALNDNKRLRIANHELAAHKQVLLKYVESVSHASVR